MCRSVWHATRVCRTIFHRPVISYHRICDDDDNLTIFGGPVAYKRPCAAAFHMRQIIFSFQQGQSSFALSGVTLVAFPDKEPAT
eukprot:2548078-Pyramimonas_sp.AAC.1